MKKVLLTEVNRFRKLAGLLKEDDYTEDPDLDPSGDTDVMSIAEDDNLDLSDTPVFRPKLKMPEDIPDGWEGIEGDPEREDYLLYFQLERGTFEPLTIAGDVFVAIEHYTDTRDYDVVTYRGGGDPHHHPFERFNEAWEFAKSEMIDIRREINDEDLRDYRFPY